ncbi:DNA-directed RNA polymerase II [Spraguea lophii 42_110]|uniref:DNA-directed RNA polymerase II n=1 Tax=Spraguea lophii (strain 42_110) TaxID=1358809 RepID=S7W7N8_SPRLO|nr:DNA-directed RNA polymerase II [Spraguea lophii 42_110]
MYKRSLNATLDKDTSNTINITLDGETHTLANLVVDRMLNDKNCIFGAYKQPHPLEEKVNIKISNDKDKLVVDSIVENMKTLEEEIDHLIGKIEEAEGKTEYGY